MNTSSTYPTRIDLCDGKYTLIYDFGTGQSECLRYGQPWRQLVGDKMVLACFDEIVELRQQCDSLRKSLIHIQQVACSGSPELGIASEALASMKGVEA